MAKVKIGIYYEIAYDGEIEIDDVELKEYFEENGYDPNNYSKDELYDASHSYVLDNMDRLGKKLSQRGVDGTFVIEI